MNRILKIKEVLLPPLIGSRMVYTGQRGNVGAGEGVERIVCSPLLPSCFAAKGPGGLTFDNWAQGHTGLEAKLGFKPYALCLQTQRALATERCPLRCLG